VTGPEIHLMSSGGTSYGAQAPPVLLQPLQNFCQAIQCFRGIFLRTKIKNCCHRLSYLKAKMHQNRFLLGLRHRPHWGSLQRSPRPPSWI